MDTTTHFRATQPMRPAHERGHARGHARAEQTERWLDTATRFSTTGGLLTADEWAQRMRQGWIASGMSHPAPDPIPVLARWLVAGSVLAIDSPWGRLLPTFQFCPISANTQPCMQALLRKLRPVFDDMELALWFVTPNPWLDNACPAQLMQQQLPMVLMAARLDRYVAGEGAPVRTAANRQG